MNGLFDDIKEMLNAPNNLEKTLYAKIMFSYKKYDEMIPGEFYGIFNKAGMIADKRQYEKEAFKYLAQMVKDKEKNPVNNQILVELENLTDEEVVSYYISNVLHIYYIKTTLNIPYPFGITLT